MNPLRNSKNPVTPIVITSKAAAKDMQNIGLRHDEMVMGIDMQNMRVAQYNQQKAADAQVQQSIQAEAGKDKMANDTENKKMEMDHEIRQGELDIQRASLMSK